MSAVDKLAFGVAAIILLPVALSPAGWVVGLFIAGLWVATVYGARWFAKSKQYEHMGAGAKDRSQDLQDIISMNDKRRDDE